MVQVLTSRSYVQSKDHGAKNWLSADGADRRRGGRCRVRDPVDGVGGVVGEQQAAIWKLCCCDWLPPDGLRRGVLVLEPAGGEHGVVGDLVVGVQHHVGQPVPDLEGAVPGAVLGHEQGPAVLLREHGAVVEPEAQGRDMGPVSLDGGDRARVAVGVEAAVNVRRVGGQDLLLSHIVQGQVCCPP